jgi:hypothetical protein
VLHATLVDPEVVSEGVVRFGFDVAFALGEQHTRMSVPVGLGFTELLRLTQLPPSRGAMGMRIAGDGQRRYRGWVHGQRDR